MDLVISDRKVRRQESVLRHVDPLLIGAPIALSMVGLAMIYSSTHRSLESNGLDPYDFVKRQGLAIVAGLVAMFVMTVIDYRKLRELAFAGYAATVLMLLAVLKIGADVKGAQARFDIGPFQLQPGEFAKLFVILVISGYCAMHHDDLSARRLAVALGLTAVPVGLILLQPDLGTDLVILASVFTVLVAAGVRARLLVVILLLGFSFSVLAVQAGVLDDYQLARLTDFANPEKSPDRSGFNAEQSKIAIGHGGLTGQGFLKGSQTNGEYVPEQHTDFIFTVVGEELGFVGGATVLALFAVIVWRTLRAARLAPDPFGMLCCMGILGMFVAQVFENVGMAMGIMPITGIPLPFMSYGGSSIIVSFACIGLVANVRMRRFS